MTSALWAVQKAVYDALKGSLTGVDVYDYVPENTNPEARPFVIVQRAVSTPADGVNFDGASVEVTINVFGRQEGSKVIKRTMDAIVLVLADESLPLDAPLQHVMTRLIQAGMQPQSSQTMQGFVTVRVEVFGS